jgi:hypothetical protein
MPACFFLGFALLFVTCVFMVNAPVPVVPLLGGAAMAVLLGSTVVGAALHALRTMGSNYPVVLSNVRKLVAEVRERVALLRILVALQVAAMTRATTDR